MSELNNYTPTPVTREEKILSGANIQPRTRMEYFLKMASENNAGNIPTPTAGDAGKVLLVNSEGQLVLDYPPRDTPVPTSEDAGSVITVNEFGAYVLGNEVPKPTSEDEGKVITVDENGEYVLGEGGGGGTDSSLPPYASEDIGKVLTVSTEDPVMHETVIVPEQTVTFEEGFADLSDITPYTGEEVPVLGGDYAGWVYLPEYDGSSFVYAMTEHPTGSDEAIRLSVLPDLAHAIELGHISVDYDKMGDASYLFDTDTSVSGTSVTISATVAVPVVPTVSSVVVPTQTVSFENNGMAQLSNVAISPEDVKLGTSVTATIIENGTAHVFTLSAEELGPALAYVALDSDGNQCMLGFDNSWMMVFGNTNTGPFSGEATVSVEGQTPKPKVKWENKDGGTLYLTEYDDNDTLNASYNDIMDAVNNGHSVCIKTLFDGVMDCAYLISAKSTGEEPYTYSVAFASVDIEGTPPSLTVSRYSASSPTENLYIATQ